MTCPTSMVAVFSYVSRSLSDLHFKMCLRRYMTYIMCWCAVKSPKTKKQTNKQKPQQTTSKQSYNMAHIATYSTLPAPPSVKCTTASSLLDYSICSTEYICSVHSNNFSYCFPICTVHQSWHVACCWTADREIWSGHPLSEMTFHKLGLPCGAMGNGTLVYIDDINRYRGIVMINDKRFG